MIEPRTYYGPWFETIPTDAPNGSLWDAVYVFQDGDTIECQIVAFNGCLIDEDMITVDRGDIARARRVWPPGSVLPDPRPVLDNLAAFEMENCHQWWAVGSTINENFTIWQIVPRNRVFPRLVPKTTICYPVQPLNGAFVPISWPDSGCTTE